MNSDSDIAETAAPCSRERCDAPPFHTVPVCSAKAAALGRQPFDLPRALASLIPSRARARSSAWCGVQRIIIFFAISFLALVAADRAVKYGMRRIETSMFGVSNRIMSGNVDAEILISGSSPGAYAL